MAKRSNGEGTWKKRANGTWEYRCYVQDPTTALINRCSFYGKTKSSCQERKRAYELYGTQYKEIFTAYQDYLRRTALGERAELPRLEETEEIAEETESGRLLKEFAPVWLETYRKGNVAENTYRSYISDLKAILADEIAEMDMQDIKPIHIQSFFNRKKASGKSKSALTKYHSMLLSIFWAGIDNDLCTKNPVKNITTPDGPTKKRIALNLEEVKIINQFALTHRFGVPILVMLYSGCRRGETVAIEKDWLDRDAGVLHLQGSVTNTGVLIGSNAKKNHERDIYLPAWLFDIIKFEDSKYLCHNDKGQRISVDGFSRRFEQFYKELMQYCTEQNLPMRQATSHCLRHTYASMLYRKEIDSFTRQCLLGHKDEESTDRYTHEDGALKQKAIILTFPKDELFPHSPPQKIKK